jgi:hypothetical protein
VVARGRPLIARGPDRIESAAPLVVVALRHLAPQGEELAALGHPHEDICIFHAELAELVRDRFICHAAILTQLLLRESESAGSQTGTPDFAICA